MANQKEFFRRKHLNSAQPMQFTRKQILAWAVLSVEVWHLVGHFPRVHLFYLKPPDGTRLPVTFLCPSDRQCYDSDLAWDTGSLSYSPK